MADTKSTVFEALKSGQSVWIARFKGYRHANNIRSSGVQEVLLLARDEDHAREVGTAWINTLAPGGMLLAVLPAFVADESILGTEAKANLAEIAKTRAENAAKQAAAEEAERAEAVGAGKR